MANLGLPVTTRAALLGHSVSTNEKYYSFDRKNSLTDVCKAMNGLTNSNANDKETEQDLLTPYSHQNIVDFAKKKAPNPLNSRLSAINYSAEDGT